MEKRRIILGIVMGFLVLAGALWAGLSWGGKFWVGKELKNIDVEEMMPKQIGSMENLIGTDWLHGFFAISNVEELQWMGMFSAISDGKLVVVPKSVYGKDGSVLFTATIGSWVYYLDSDNNLQKIYRPIEVELPGGEKLMVVDKKIRDEVQPLFINHCHAPNADAFEQLITIVE